MSKKASLITALTCTIAAFLTVSFVYFYESTSDELNKSRILVENLRDTYNTSVSKIDELSEQLFLVSSNLETANSTLEDLKRNEYELVNIGDFKVTYYCNESEEHICGIGQQITASGKPTEVGWTVATDWNVLPNGAIIYIEGIGFREVMDVGSAVSGNHIDVLVENHEEALNLGVDYKNVWVLVRKY